MLWVSSQLKRDLCVAEVFKETVILCGSYKSKRISTALEKIKDFGLTGKFSWRYRTKQTVSVGDKHIDQSRAEGTQPSESLNPQAGLWLQSTQLLGLQIESMSGLLCWPLEARGILIRRDQD